MEEARPILADRIANGEGRGFALNDFVHEGWKPYFHYTIEHVSSFRKGAAAVRKGVHKAEDAADQLRAKAKSLRPEASPVEEDNLPLLNGHGEVNKTPPAPKGAGGTLKGGSVKQQRPPTRGYVPLPHTE